MVHDGLWLVDIIEWQTVKFRELPDTMNHFVVRVIWEFQGKPLHELESPNSLRVFRWLSTHPLQVWLIRLDLGCPSYSPHTSADNSSVFCFILGKHVSLKCPDMNHEMAWFVCGAPLLLWFVTCPSLSTVHLDIWALLSNVGSKKKSPWKEGSYISKPKRKKNKWSS